jgi:RNA polymerase sigma-70 factor (ECF subfamily)
VHVDTDRSTYDFPWSRRSEYKDQDDTAGRFDGPTIMGASANSADPGRSFDAVLSKLRPKLHRYCARLVGSVIDGEDVVQQALVKAFEAFGDTRSVDNLEGWLFRIAHNAAIDFLRHRARHTALHSDGDLDMFADPVSNSEQHQIAAASLRTLMRLPVTQRSSVILMDVLGYSLDEISAITGSSVPAIKTAMHRGRARLRELALEHDEVSLPLLREPERTLLAEYIDRFNARDFDAIRNMLAEEVRLDLVGREKRQGRKEVSTYFGNYRVWPNWYFVLGFVERRPAIIVHDPNDPSGKPIYFILLKWEGGRVVDIRDFTHARYTLDGADLLPLSRLQNQ